MAGQERQAGAVEARKGRDDCRQKRHREHAAVRRHPVHVEFCEPTPAGSGGQGRGNSGVFLMDLYEVQVLDGYDNKTYADGATAGAVRAASAPGQRLPAARPMAGV